MDYSIDIKEEEKRNEKGTNHDHILKSKQSFQLKDLSQRNVKVDVNSDKSENENYFDTINEKESVKNENTDKEDIVEETFDNGTPNDNFLLYDDKSNDEISPDTLPKKKDLDDVFNDKSSENGI